MDSVIYKKLLTPERRTEFHEGFQRKSIAEQSLVMADRLSAELGESRFSPVAIVALNKLALENGLKDLCLAIRRNMEAACGSPGSGLKTLRGLTGYIAQKDKPTYSQLLRWLPAGKPSATPAEKVEDVLMCGALCEANSRINNAMFNDDASNTGVVLTIRFLEEDRAGVQKLISSGGPLRRSTEIVVGMVFTGLQHESPRVPKAVAVYRNSEKEGPPDSLTYPIFDHVTYQLSSKLTASEACASTVRDRPDLMRALGQWNPAPSRSTSTEGTSSAGPKLPLMEKFVITFYHAAVRLAADEFLK